MKSVKNQAPIAHGDIDRATVILNNQGYSYMLRGDLHKARRKFLAAFEREPDNPYIKNNLELLNESEKSIKRVRSKV